MTDIPAGVPANVRAALESEGVMKVPGGGGGSGFSSRHESDSEAALFDFEGQAAKEAETTKSPAKGKETVEPTEEVDERRVEREQPGTEEEGTDEKTEAPPEEEKAEESEGVALADDLDGLAEQLGMKPDELAGHLKVKIGDTQVPLSEVLKGYSPEAKAKEAELAEHRQKFDEAVGQARTTWQQKMQQADALIDYFKGQFLNRQPPDPELLNPQSGKYDPAEFLRQKEANEQGQATYKAIMGERLKIQDQEQAELKQQRDKMLGEQYELLIKALPDLKDEAKWKAWTGDIRAYAKSAGIGDDMLADVHHHQAWVMMDKARKWDALQKAKPELQKKIAKLPPLNLKPGVKSRPMDDSTRTLLDARKRLQRSGVFEGVFQRKTRR